MMRTIQVIGSGCSKCRKLAANAERAACECAAEARVVKIREIADMLRFDGLRGLPALAIDGEVKVCGRVPGVEEIKAILGSVEPT
jgi:small redox-active disulfide protein 2